MRKLFNYVASVMLALSCITPVFATDDGSHNDEITLFEFTEDTIECRPSDNITLPIHVEPADANLSVITWEYSNQDIASVTYDNLPEIKANVYGKGETVITATTPNGLTDSIKIISKYDDPEMINFSYPPSEMIVGEDKEVSANVKPNGYPYDNSVTYESSDESVIAIEAMGNDRAVLHALKEGTAVITASTVNGLKDAKSITVKDVKPESISIKEKQYDSTRNLCLNAGESRELSWEVSPEKTKLLPVTWASSDESVVTVSSGTVTAISDGKATITVTTINGLTDSIDCYVGLTEPLSFSFYSSSQEINVGEFGGAAYESIPYIRATELEWVSSDESIAKIEANDWYVRIYGIAPGTAVVTAKTVNGLTSSMTITVKEVETVSDADVEEISILDKRGNRLNGGTLEWNVNDKREIRLDVTPVIATENITWTSSNSDVIAIENEDRYGMRYIHAVGEGTSTITVAALNGMSESFTVNVSGFAVPIDHVELLVHNIDLKQSGSYQIPYKIYPENAKDDGSIDWHSQYGSVSIDEHGVMRIASWTWGYDYVWVGEDMSGGISVNFVTDEFYNDKTVSLDDNYVSLQVGDTYQLNAVISSNNQENVMQWKSNNVGVAVVDENGKITIVGKGYAEITASCGDGYDICKVVAGVEPKGDFYFTQDEIRVTPSNVYLILDPYLNNSYYDNRYINFSSSAPEIVEYSKNSYGDWRIIALKVGEAIITAESPDGQKSR